MGLTLVSPLSLTTNTFFETSIFKGFRKTPFYKFYVTRWISEWIRINVLFEVEGEQPNLLGLYFRKGSKKTYTDIQVEDAGLVLSQALYTSFYPFASAEENGVIDLAYNKLVDENIPKILYRNVNEESGRSGLKYSLEKFDSNIYKGQDVMDLELLEILRKTFDESILLNNGYQLELEGVVLDNGIGEKQKTETPSEEKQKTVVMVDGEEFVLGDVDVDVVVDESRAGRSI